LTINFNPGLIPAPPGLDIIGSFFFVESNGDWELANVAEAPASGMILTFGTHSFSVMPVKSGTQGGLP
jgi:hypothetical protein